MGINANVRPKKCKKARFAIGNVSMKDLLKIIKVFEKLPYKDYERNRHKHETINSYFYLERQLENCMMRYDALN